ncbi:WYL domain-containing protein [Bacteroides sp. OttesenSCG-928-D19]|nr:WYL domain-containing protein [Bacteroides sp. OttesenSCG-928-D19]
MPINKDAMLRYKVLDKCFRNTGRNYQIRDLVEECNKKLLEVNPDSKGICKRQVYYDIRFMESSEGWEIDLEDNKDGRNRYFRYSDPSFSIDNMPLNETEVAHLQSAIDVLGYFTGMHQFEWVRDIHDTLNKMAITAQSHEQKTVVEFENNPDTEGSKFFKPIYDAIINKKVLRVTYQPFDSPEMKIVFHPYYLKQYNRCWYAFGLNPTDDSVMWNLALERIVSISETKMKYKTSTIDWSEYFDDVMGVTRMRDVEVENIVIHVLGKMAKFIAARPLHAYQKHKWIDKDTLEVRFRLIVNFELEKILLSYADSIKVIQPESLKISHIKRLKDGLRIYE